MLLKKHYLSLNNMQIKRIIWKARRLPFYSIRQIMQYKPVRVKDKFLAFLERRLGNVLQKTGLNNARMGLSTFISW
jgi:ribosomal protein S4